MSAFLVALTAAIYGLVAFDQALKGNAAMALVYVGYTVANLGFWIAFK